MRRGTELHPRIIYDTAELPAAIHQTLAPYLAAQTTHRLIMIPAQHYRELQEGPWWRALLLELRITPVRTLAFQDDRILIVEGAGGEYEPDLAVIVIPAANLVAIQLATVLLYSYVELWWAVADRIETIRIEFNSVGADVIERELRRLRSAEQPQREMMPLTELAPVDPVAAHEHKQKREALPLKFRNFIRTSLLPGETIHAIIYEPAIRQPGVRLNPFLSPNRAIVLTDQNLIMIKDARPGKKGHSLSNVYRYDRFFVPRRYLHNVKVSIQSDITYVDFLLGTSRAQQTESIPLLPPRVAELRRALADWPVEDALRV
ncbi:MAG: hypothetical protein JXA10_09410 [Anaerolineae bacterium]|nr:hypothetical protein [Anaerolineae bacterium]